jgi:hypothetical protein
MQNIYKLMLNRLEGFRGHGIPLVFMAVRGIGAHYYNKSLQR